MPARENVASAAQKLHIDPIIAKLMINRGITSTEAMHSFLYPTLDNLHDPHLMTDMDAAVDEVVKAIHSNAKIRIIGDYDVDGVMSTYILMTGLKAAGATVDYDIPHRIEDGYGMNPAMVDRAYNAGINYIITCDNGIAAIEAVDRANSYGIKVIVTDHHKIQTKILEDGTEVENLPAALAIVDPHRQGDKYPFKEICGAVVAYKLIEVLYEKLNIDSTKLKPLIQFAGFATECDVMPLTDENRSILKYALSDMLVSDNKGLSALIRANSLPGKKGTITAGNLGFQLGPCINATGRLEDAKLSVNLLLEDDDDICRDMAARLVALNTDRKEITTQGEERAYAMVEEIIRDRQALPDIICLYMPGVHESIAGLIAGRLKERYYRPSIVLTDADEKGVIKGSARSIDSYNMFEELSRVKDIFIKYGGHPMAAGMSLPRDKYEELDRRLNENSRLTEEEKTETVNVDVKIKRLSCITVDLINTIEKLEPFGLKNPKPLFGAKVWVNGINIMGKDRNHLKMYIIDDTQKRLEAVTFYHADKYLDIMRAEFGKEAVEKLLINSRGSATSYVVEMELLFTLQTNEAFGQIVPQLMIEDIRKPVE